MKNRPFAVAALLSLAVSAALPQLTLGQPMPDAPERPAAAPANVADVPVRAVVLFSSGVGYFEHAGTVEGNATADLRFKTAQVNDLLKSLVLQDLDGGTVASVTYPSQDPVEKTLKSFQIDLSGNPPLAQLLEQLRGARVTIAVAGEQVTGTVLGVEKRQVPSGPQSPPVDAWFASLFANGTIRQVDLRNATEIKVLDANLQQELDRALSAIASARDQDKKPVTIRFAGDGLRRVRLGYVVETPIWKTSYRLILPAKPEEKAKVQGWAIVENQTDQDWTDVQLSLVSGRPISFVQDLYKPLYVSRPVVQPELYASLRPQDYDEGLANEQKVAMGLPQRLRGGVGSKRGPAPAAAPAPSAGGMAGEFADASMVRSEAMPTDAAASVQSVASAEKVGELFQYTVGNVTLARQKSAMLPIVTDDVEAEKVSIYNQSALAKHPLNGALLKNTTGKHLLAGPVTVLEAGTYAGDAKLDNVTPTQERLLSYGIDLQVRVNAEKNTSDATTVGGRIDRGVLYVARRNTFSQTYVADSKADADKTLIVEHPARPGLKLVDSTTPYESTEQLHRFRVPLPAGKQAELTVKQQITTDEAVALLPADLDAVVVYSRMREIPQQVRDALAKAADLKRAVVETERQIEQIDERVNAITNDQSRIRENLKTPNTGERYRARLAETLDQQETELQQLRDKRAALQRALDERRAALEQYLGSLTVG